MRIGYKVCDAMTEKPLTIDKNSSLMECANVMKDNHVGALIINEKNSHDILYIITEQDIVRKGVSIGLDPEMALVSEVMIKIKHTIEPQKDIFDALMIMRDLNIRHLPVVNNKKMIGLLTLKDILKIEPQLFDILVEKFELREEEKKPIHIIKEKEGICNLCGKYFEKLIQMENHMVCEACSKNNS